MAGCTLGMAAALWAPAVLQAVLVLRPDFLGEREAAAALSFTLAGSIVAFPALVKSLLRGGVASRRKRGSG